MNKILLKKTITVSLIFGVLFFLLNYVTGSDSSIGQLLLKSLLVIVVFALLYYVLFSIVDSPERKYKFGITIPIALLIAIIICALISTIKVGIIIGLILGIIAGYVWEYIEKNKDGGDKS
ncbi:hypothetical protein M4L39_08860 [Staphylococcus equorum]|uniref:Uncharacterized protein n=1 Tax=Staphylococcus equorum TaxID=246432 RepID=A0A9X4LAC0_9STAP|nr:hypothetical protein [Staphylococcus equorum]MDG0843551.1 hypothetical protein [Staphylococcus equorum]MDG0859895.1 hypothetical protein [Staphylococcus equorum]